MPLWDKLKTELDRAGRAAQQALDEGKTRLDAHRARAAADKCAQRLGYAVYRARAAGGEIAPDEYRRLAADLSAAEAEVDQVEKQMSEATAKRGGGAPPPPPDPQPPV